jgi:hypothetical protein
MNTRFTAALNGTFPNPLTKTENVGVARAPMNVVTLDWGAEKQAPVLGFVWHTDRLIGSDTAPVSAEMVMLPPAPTFEVATASAPRPLAILTMPSLGDVAAIMMTSGAGDEDAESNIVFTPEMTRAALTLLHEKVNVTSVGPNALPIVKAIKNDCPPPAGIEAGVLGEPVRVFVDGSVVWYMKVAGTAMAGLIAQSVAVVPPPFRMVAKAVAVPPTWTERLLGRIAAANGVLKGGTACTDANASTRPNPYVKS